MTHTLKENQGGWIYLILSRGRLRGEGSERKSGLGLGTRVQDIF